MRLSWGSTKDILYQLINAPENPRSTAIFTKLRLALWCPLMILRRSDRLKAGGKGRLKTLFAIGGL